MEEQIWAYLFSDDSLVIMEGLFWIVIVEKFPKVCKFDNHKVFNELTE